MRIFLLCIGLACVMASCQVYENDPNTISEPPQISLTGTVTITRGGIPLNHDNFPIYGVPEEQYHNRIWLRSYITPDGYSVGNLVSVFSNETDAALGKYTWVMNIDSRSIPGLIFFEVGIPATSYPVIKMTEGIWIQNTDSIVDIGIVDFNVVRLFGNLPVTFNGNPPADNMFGSLYRNPEIIIIHPPSSSTAFSIPIQPNGDWMWDVIPDIIETPVRFSVEAREKGGIFSIYLNPNHIINIPPTGGEIIFPDYPNIDFKAFSLAGAVNIPDFGTGQSWIYIEFYHQDFPPDSLIGRVEILLSQTNENGLYEWSLLVPAFPLPVELIFKLMVYTAECRRTYFGRFEITDETVLGNIDLGTFTVNY